jgi:hypothetical protein
MLCAPEPYNRSFPSCERLFSSRRHDHALGIVITRATLTDHSLCMSLCAALHERHTSTCCAEQLAPAIYTTPTYSQQKQSYGTIEHRNILWLVTRQRLVSRSAIFGQSLPCSLLFNINVLVHIRNLTLKCAHLDGSHGEPKIHRLPVREILHRYRGTAALAKRPHRFLCKLQLLQRRAVREAARCSRYLYERYKCRARELLACSAMAED